MNYIYLIPWALIPVLIVIGCIRAKPEKPARILCLPHFPAAALDSPVLETPTQGDGSNSEETK